MSLIECFSVYTSSVDGELAAEAGRDGEGKGK